MGKDISEYKKGTYGYDVNFFTDHKISTIELKDPDSGASVLIVPAFQGRVMTSTSEGLKGKSYGWINYDLIASDSVSNQFNPYGGEERLWLGPEGGPFSIYFKKGEEQVYENWKVPKPLDTEEFEVRLQNNQQAAFSKDFELENAIGTTLSIGIIRTVKLLSKPDIERILYHKLDEALNYVAYESRNILINKGSNNWNESDGVLSVWMLSMFQPSVKGIVFIPFKDDNADLGKIVTDDYFGKVPSDRLIVKNGTIFFKTDGKYRSKIGVSPLRAQPICGSYDPVDKVLTILSYSLPDSKSKYVNSVWGIKEDLLTGDVVNSYNDGPVADGTIMGPFYEIESSSPAAILSAGDSILHKQQIFHFSGSEEKLDAITTHLFNLTIAQIESAFN